MNRPAAGLAAVAILGQIGYPLTPSGAPRSVLTAVTVGVFCAAGVADAYALRGHGWALRYTVVTLLVGFSAEAVGVATGVPFGRYSYADSLGPKLAGVPLLIPVAWAMFAYPALVVGRRVGRTRWLRRAAGALALASWDLFLDPQMVEAGHWRWADPHPALPGIPGIPVTNVVGWLVVAAVLVTVLDALLPAVPADETVPAVLFGWTWLGSTLAAVAFFGRPSVGLVGGLVMAVPAVPYFRSLWRSQHPTPAAQPA